MIIAAYFPVTQDTTAIYSDETVKILARVKREKFGIAKRARATERRRERKREREREREQSRAEQRKQRAHARISRNAGSRGACTIAIAFEYK